MILQDYLLFDRKLRLKYYFHDRQIDKRKDSAKNTLPKASSGWTPPGSQNQNFDTYSNLTQSELMNELTIPPLYNRFHLPKCERKAMKSLSGNPNIVIKPADKGGKIVIQDTLDYIKEGERQLNDTTFYKRLFMNPTKELNERVKMKLEQGIKEGFISTMEVKSMFNPEPRISYFYTLPKIHKENNPGRPIVNGIGSITEKISAYVDENRTFQ